MFQSCLVFLPGTFYLSPGGCFRFNVPKFVIFSFPASLAGSPACLLLKSPKSACQPPFSLGRDAGLAGHPCQLRAECNRMGSRVSAGAGEVCTTAFGLLLSVIGGLLGQGLTFPQRAVWELGRQAHAAHRRLLCALSPWCREEPFRWGGRRPHPHACRRQPAGVGGRDGFFSGHLPYASEAWERKVSMAA